ncbi:MAG: helix-turn-helix domain-containing protein [Lachnospiraceae bacterium]|nr:helix-turn-helix domain-containing protein [Lachnospiraceae bacterium]
MNKINQSTNIRAIFSANINFLMKERGITRKKACSDLGIKYTTFCDWINGRTLPREDQLVKLGKYFDLEPGDLLVEMNSDNPQARRKRLSGYTISSRRLSMDLLNTLSDDQIMELIRSGFTFEHKTLEDYVRESGGKIIASDEMDWGEPVGSEVW